MRRALLLRRGVYALERIASAMELALGADPTAQPDESELERFDGLTETQEELAAMIEILEEQGVTVPASSYRALGLEPPRNERDPTEEELNADQPGEQEQTPEPPEPPEPTDPNEPIVARRK